jgi:hypothetical protein
MGFIQIIEVRTSNADELAALEAQWEQATEGTRTTRRRILCRDRNDPTRYFNLVFFDSYESAMHNSQLDATQEFAGRLAKVIDGEPVFYDLDIVDERS